MFFGLFFFNCSDETEIYLFAKVCLSECKLLKNMKATSFVVPLMKDKIVSSKTDFLNVISSEQDDLCFIIKKMSCFFSSSYVKKSPTSR